MRRILWGWILILAAMVALAADVTGTWAADVVLEAGTGTATFTLRQEGQKISGTYSGVVGTAEVSGSVDGARVQWSFSNSQVGTVTYKGTFEGDTRIKGEVDYGPLGKGTFTAAKK